MEKKRKEERRKKRIEKRRNNEKAYGDRENCHILTSSHACGPRFCYTKHSR